MDEANWEFASGKVWLSSVLVLAESRAEHHASRCCNRRKRRKDSHRTMLTRGHEGRLLARDSVSGCNTITYGTGEERGLFLPVRGGGQLVDSARI